MEKVCGLDVHKDSIFCAVFDGEKTSGVKEFKAFTQTIKDMGEWLKQEGVKKIAMESTSIYWIPIWNVLESMEFELMLVNPYLIKQMPGRKSDVKDAQWIAILLYKNLLRSSFVPNKPIREMRSYSREYVKLGERISHVTQKMESILEMSNIRITSLMSKNNGVSVIKIIEKIIDGKDTIEDLINCVHGRTINTHGDFVKLALEGHIEEHHRFNLKIAYDQYKLFLEQQNQINEKMAEICDKSYPEQVKLLETLPGVKKQSAMQIVAETGGDMKAFESSCKLTGWAGLRPRNDESAGKLKNKAVTKGNKYLRKILVQCAWAASRTKETFFKNKFAQLCIRKSRKKALIAIARKLLVVVWHVLSEKKPFNSCMYSVHNPEKIRAKIAYHRGELAKLESLGF